MSAPSTSSFSGITVTCYRRKIWLLYLFLAIYKAGAVWISLRSMLSRTRGTRVLDISSFAPPPPRPRQKNAPATQSMIGTYSRTLAQNEPVEDGQRAGEINVQSCYTGSSVMSSKMLKSRHLRKFQTMISSSMCVTLALFDNAANQRAPGELQLEDWTRPSPWGLLHIVFSL